MFTKKKELCSGKTKTLFATEQDDLLVAEFRDDITAFNAGKHEQLENKGKVNNELNAFFMQRLQQEGVPTHLVKKISDTESVFKRLNMIPLECVVRNIAAGSLCKRLGIEPNKQLNPPLYELFLKDDELGDPLVTDNHALSFGWANEGQLQEMKRLSLKIHAALTDLLSQKGMILVDAKYEFGLDAGGVVTLGDEISPDSCRIWDAKTREILDKDRFRQDLGNVIPAYQQVAERLKA